ncbi:glutathione S-transferase C-terminal-like protein [Cubamyces lactineus]|nr:glutathione S-transferase C-terminal-like protein [Cubamyces lactineus]
MTSSVLTSTFKFAKPAVLGFGRGQVRASGLAAVAGARKGRVQGYSTATSPSTKPLLLYTAGTPNGRKVSVFLEELKEVYGLPYDVHPIDISKNVQKERWFLALNPNGRIPVLVDRNRGDFPVFETGAILLYLAHHYDTLRKFAFDPATHPNEHSEMLQWMFFAHGGIGPMQGQANHFVRVAPEDIPYAKKRYVDETKRLYGVLDMRLKGRDWLAGAERGMYSIADMNALPWVSSHGFTSIETLDAWPNVKAWVEQAMARPAVQAGMRVP